ncbi:MAG: DUF6677 family protein [Planctomycetota bacterium]
MPPQTDTQREVFSPLAGLLAVLLPGLGYLAHGERQRALLVGGGILGLIFFGVLVGGINVVDRANDGWWFLLQGANGPIAFLLDYLHRGVFPTPGAGHFSSTPAATPSLAKVNEVGTLSVALAGLLNAIAILDCLFHPVRDRREERAP